MRFSIAGGGRNKKIKLARGREGGKKEKRAARKIALNQIQLKKKNSVSLYIGKPKTTLWGNLDDRHTLYLTDCQRGVVVPGGNGSGKTYSLINPLLRSAIDQGLAVIAYDFKYPSQNGENDGSSQTEQIVGYAEQAGYKIYFYCPGFKESFVCNPLDFLRPRHGLPAEADAETARQIGMVMNRNFKMFAAEKEDPFFGPAGDQLMTAILMLAKGSLYPDVMMCQALLSVEDLVGRLKAAELNPWVRAAFGQLLSVGGSERTVASIAGTANINFSRFMMPGVLSSVCGKTTLPLDLTKKQLIVFGMDRERRDVVGPLLATVLHMIVNRNVSGGRKTPLILSLDEVPTLYLPAIANWLAEARSEGLCTILGFQNIAQIEEVYGKKWKTIFGNCANKAIFNPLEPDSAEYYSKLYGDIEIQYKQKSKGRSGGKSSTNTSEQEKSRRLYEPSFFTTLTEGCCVLSGPGYRSKQGGREEGFIPLVQKIKIPEADIKASEASVADWPDIRAEYVASNTQKLPTKDDLKARYEEADKMIALPQKKAKVAA